MVGGEAHCVRLLPFPHCDEELVGLWLFGVGCNADKLLVWPLKRNGYEN